MPEATIKWVEGMKFVGYGDSRHALVMDAGETSGGANTGIRPAELLLVAVGGCTGIDVISILNKMRIHIDSLEIRVSGEWSPEHPKYWSRIALKYIVTGKDVSEEKVKKAIELSQEKYCSVAETFRRNVAVSHTYEIREEKP